MTKEDAINFNDNLKEKRQDISNKHAEIFWKLLKEHTNEKEKNKLINKLIDDFYIWSEETISEILSEMRDFYGDIGTEIFPYHFYDKDGKTPEDRIKSIINDSATIEKALQRLVLILDTESNYLTYQTIKHKFMSNDDYIAICQIVGNPRDCDSNCESYLMADPRPLKSMSDIDMPPYHPDCQCSAIVWVEKVK